MIHAVPRIRSRFASVEGTTVPGRFIALEGPDGVGKTTLAKRLGTVDYAGAVATLPSRSVAGSDKPAPLVFVSRRQISATSAYSADLMRQLADVLWHSGESTDLPDAFWVAVQAAWATAHGTTVLGPILEAGNDVITDGWVYKFFSKLLVQGYTLDQLEVIFGRVRMPDAVILLAADPGALYDRRHAEFRPSELGMHAGYQALGRDTFVTYQRQGLVLLQNLAETLGWHTVNVDPAISVDDTRDLLTPVVTAARTVPRATATAPS
jgi:thymidylate kinase